MFGRLFKRKDTPAEALDDFPPPEPRTTIYAVGDIHGRADLLDRMIGMIDADAAQSGVAAPEIVLLGDYVDRGQDSRGVIERIVALRDDPARRVTCLMGNHEDMMLDFIDQTGSRGDVWLDNGGLQTLESFAVGGLFATRTSESVAEAAGRLGEAIGQGTLDWLRRLPRRHRSGNVHFIHAAADPTVPMEDQDAEMLIWGRPSRRQPPRSDGQWIIHGHTVVDAPDIAPGRINVDTGACFSGTLTAVRVSPGETAFLST